MRAMRVAVQEPVPRPTADTVQITFRIPTSLATRADVIAKALSRPGIDLQRTDALRAAINRGFDLLENELGIGPPPPPESAPARKRGK